MDIDEIADYGKPTMVYFLIATIAGIFYFIFDDLKIKGIFSFIQLLSIIGGVYSAIIWFKVYRNNKKK